MKVDVLNIEGKKVDSTELPSPIFEAPIREDLMHQAFVRQLANARLGTHSTKSRGGRRRCKTLAAEGDWACPSWVASISDLGGWW